MARYVQKFEVCGKGEFPFDMLRYDHCYPDTSEDSVNMDEDRMMPRNERPVRYVKLSRVVDSVKHLPTVARWASFGWTVVCGVNNLPAVTNIKI